MPPDRLPLPRRLAIAWVATTLVAGGYLGQILSADNRLYMFFDWTDTVLVLSWITVVGLTLGFILHEVGRKTRWQSDRWLSPWFYFVGVLIIFNNNLLPRETLVRFAPWLSPQLYYLIIWGAGLVLTGAGYRCRSWRKGAHVGWQVMFVLWPILLIIPYSLAIAPKWENIRGDPAQLGMRSNGDSPALVVIILDAVGYAEAFNPDGLVHDDLTHLAEFSSSAMVFHRATSGGYYTGTSLPSLFFQQEVMYPILHNETVRWQIRGRASEPPRSPRDFERALPYRFRDAGGRSVYLGFYLPYKKIMPDAWSEALILPVSGAVYKDNRYSLTSRSLFHLIRYVGISKDPVSALLKQFGIHGLVFDKHWRVMTAELQEAAETYIRECLSSGDLLIIHLNIPHSPYVYNADGNPVRDSRDPLAYRRQLQYADGLFGRLLADVKSRGLWDSSWVVMLSDHGRHNHDWNHDPEGKRHVPFMVKAPGQKERRDIDTPIRLVDFHRIPGFALPGNVGSSIQQE